MGYKLYIEDIAVNPVVKVLLDTDPVPLGDTGDAYIDYSQDLLAWKAYGLQGCRDYTQFRTRVIEQLDIKTWGVLSDAEKDFVIEIYAKETALTTEADATNKITYLITTGQASTVEEGRIFLVNAWADHHILDVVACGQRATAVRLYSDIGIYLSLSDTTDFFTTVENLYFAFERQAIKGSKDGSEIGLFDYVESTPGTVYEFAGLASKGYTMQNGDPDETNLISDIMKIIRKGMY
ncbi:hypothetical protein KAR91_82370 [Candidatus Pacearchaeota archaeon]|nr:hypothetical protein [Candidatus Pacearchaeota archaeon]